MTTICANCLQKRLFGSGSEAARILIKNQRGAAGLLYSRPEVYKRVTTRPAEYIRQRRYYASIEVPRDQRRQFAHPSMSSRRVLETELARAAEVIQSPTVPSEVAIHDALQICEHLAHSVTDPAESSKEPRRLDKTPTSNLLSLEEHASKASPPKVTKRPDVQDEMRDKIANTALRIIADARIFISPESLSLYVTIQTVLRRPQSLPRVFDLYASKPIATIGSSPAAYRDPSPNSAKTAVPLPVARKALDAALEAKDLPLCLNIITTTVGTSAFWRAKFIRKALLPAIALALSPAAAYALGKAYADHQERLDPQYATVMGSLCIMTYFSMTALTGYAAITTANDQMDRVTWQVGTPLYKRWFREEERAFTDSVAQAWGFKDYLRRGEEEGEDWTNLREWIMERQMVLDNPALMEGME